MAWAWGESISTAVRPSDTVGRLGADEFVVVCEDADAAAGQEIAHRVRFPDAAKGEVPSVRREGAGDAEADSASAAGNQRGLRKRLRIHAAGCGSARSMPGAGVAAAKNVGYGSRRARRCTSSAASRR